MLGQTEEEVRDYRRTMKGLLGGPGTFSVGRRRQTVPRVSEEELVYLPRGWWHLSRVRRGRQQRPVPVKAGRAPAPPAAYRDLFVPLLDADHAPPIGSTGERTAERPARAQTDHTRATA